MGFIDILARNIIDQVQQSENAQKVMRKGAMMYKKDTDQLIIRWMESGSETGLEI
jgi:hypothetical protein